MSDRARELAERICRQLGDASLKYRNQSCVEMIEEEVADFERTAEQRGYNAGLERAAQTCEVASVHELGEGATRIKLTAKIRSLIGSSPDTDREKRLAAFALAHRSHYSLTDQIAAEILAAFNESDAKARREAAAKGGQK